MESGAVLSLRSHGQPGAAGTTSQIGQNGGSLGSSQRRFHTLRQSGCGLYQKLEVLTLGGIPESAEL